MRVELIDTLWKKNYMQLFYSKFQNLHSALEEPHLEVSVHIKQDSYSSGYSRILGVWISEISYVMWYGNTQYYFNEKKGKYYFSKNLVFFL